MYPYWPVALCNICQGSDLRGSSASCSEYDSGVPPPPMQRIATLLQSACKWHGGRHQEGPHVGQWQGYPCVRGAWSPATSRPMQAAGFGRRLSPSCRRPRPIAFVFQCTNQYERNPLLPLDRVCPAPHHQSSHRTTPPSSVIPSWRTLNPCRNQR